MNEATKPSQFTLSDQAEAEKFIIGIGASAGGMDAIHEVFDHTPTDAVSYVIVQHLSPDHKSFMKELLKKHSKLKIHVAEDGMEVLPNQVYVLPEGKNMTISDGRLRLKDRQGSTPNSAVDIFFNSLAQDLGDKSVGIIFSGNGADGTKGAEAIKKVGGLVIVQDPETATFKSMPRSVIESGYYDYILAPKMIPLQIVKYIKHRILAHNFSKSEINEDSLSKINKLISDHTPLDFSEYRRPTIIRRITRRMVAQNVETIDDYIKLLKENPLEIEKLSKEFLISVTSFFRDKAAFEVIANQVIPEIVENKLMVDVLKVWVVGCATGEEAFSLAILIKEHLTEVKKDLEVKIFASDIDKEALAKASKGCYPESIRKDVSEKRLNNFFMKIGDEYKVRDNIRKMIIFADHDIIHQPPYGKIDLISCRNLMIYFNPTLQKKIFSTLNYCLNAEGYLFLGPSEGLGALKNSFREIDRKWKIFKSTEDKSNAQFKSYDPQHLEVRKPFYSSTLIKPKKNSLEEDLTNLLNQSTLEEAGFLAGVCVDENNKVLKPFGDFQNYLLPKLFNNDLLELLPSELAIAVGTSIKKAINEDAIITVKDVNFKLEEELRSVNILVKPRVQTVNEDQKVIFIYFSEGEVKSDIKRDVEVFDRELHTRRYLADLERELAASKKRLSEAHESLDELHRNIQSYNEELLSGNEELQSSNEELQSMNEELNTVNHEYQLKIKELAEINDDLDNYFRSTYISQIYVDKDMILRKFNPLTIKQINIKESDTGRSIKDISNNLRLSTFIEDIQEVIQTEIWKERQVETTEGKSYMMMIVPYVRSQVNKTDGAIITFNDITEIVNSKRIIQETNKKLVSINRDHDTFINSASGDLKVPLSNMQDLLSHLKESSDPKKIKEFMIPLIQSVSRLKETISELTDITRIDQASDKVENVNLDKLVDEVKKSISDSLATTGVKVTTQFEEREIEFSKKDLRSIFFYLLSNAVKNRSFDRQTEINITSRRIDGAVILSFKDNGTGIKPNKIDEIFSKFRPVYHKKKTSDGVGIGLYLVEKIISNAGGDIYVESLYGKGSSFTIYLKDKMPIVKDEIS